MWFLSSILARYLLLTALHFLTSMQWHFATSAWMIIWPLKPLQTSFPFFQLGCLPLEIYPRCLLYHLYMRSLDTLNSRLHSQTHSLGFPLPGPQHPEASVTKKIKNYIFKLNEVIGRGSFSTVYRGYEESTEELVAIKVIELNRIHSPTLLKLLYSEVDILKSAKHPNILRCLDVYFSASNCYIVTQYCGGGDMRSLIAKQGPLEQSTSKKLVLGIYQGLKYLASEHIIHRDLKAANVFIKDGQPKIADFGFANRTKDTFKDVNIGSPLCMSPQGLIDNIYGPKTDVWALGILLYQIFHGKTPFGYCKTQQELKSAVSQQLKCGILDSSLSKDLRELIMSCLQVKHSCRISMQQIELTNYMKKARESMQVGNLVVSQVEQYRPDVYDESIVSTEVPIQSQRKKGYENKTDTFEDTLQSKIKRGRNSLYPKTNIIDFKVKSPRESKMDPKLHPAHRNMSYGQINFKNTLGINREQKQDTGSGLSDRRLTVFPRGKGAKNLNCTVSNLRTKNSSPLKTPNSRVFVIENLRQFDDILAILHYCRILFKTIKLCEKHTFRKLQYLGSWLFKLLEELTQSTRRIMRPSTKILQLKDIISQYTNKYRSELSFSCKLNLNVSTVQSTIAEIMNQLESFLSEEAMVAVSYLVFLYDITGLLQKSTASSNHEYFTENNRIEEFLAVKQRLKSLQFPR